MEAGPGGRKTWLDSRGILKVEPNHWIVRRREIQIMEPDNGPDNGY